MSIGTSIDCMSKGLKEKAREEKWWNGEEMFNWSNVMGEASHLPSTKLASPQERYCAGKSLLESLSAKGTDRVTTNITFLAGLLIGLAEIKLHLLIKGGSSTTVDYLQLSCA